MPRGRPKKPPEERLGDSLPVRFTTGDRDLIAHAAAVAKLDVSAWLRERAVAAARAELAGEHKKPCE